MQKLFVYADFNWLDTPQLIGELTGDSVRGSEIYGPADASRKTTLRKAGPGRRFPMPPDNSFRPGQLARTAHPEQYGEPQKMRLLFIPYRARFVFRQNLLTLHG